MKNLKIKTAIVILLTCILTTSFTTEARSPTVIWTFYSADYDMTVYWNPGSHTVTNIDWNGHNPTNILDNTAATYFAIDDVLYMNYLEVYDDDEHAEWRTIVGPFERQ